MPTKTPVENFLEFARSKRFVLFASILSGLYVFAWSTKWTFDPFSIGTFWPGRFFTAQADAMLHGHLWVKPQDIPGECFFHDGQCYGYFGIFPSVIRIPFVLFLGPNVPEASAMFIAIAAGISVWAALDLCQRIVSQACPNRSATSSVFMLVSALALGPGSILVLLSDPYVYQEAIVWSIAGTLLGSNLIWRWWNERRQWQLVSSMIAFTCAAGSRPTTAVVGLAIAICIYWLLNTTKQNKTKKLLLPLTLSILPLIATFGVLFVKFDTVTQPFDSYEQAVSPTWRMILNANDGKLVGTKFAPTLMVAFLRPDTLRLSKQSPWITFRFGNVTDPKVKPITFFPKSLNQSMYVERNLSITNAMPLAFVSTIAAAYALLRRRRRSIELVILAALCTPILATAVNVSVTARYLGDMYPLIAVGLAFSGALIPQVEQLNKNRRNILLGVVGLITVFSLLAMPILTRQYSWVYRFGMQ